MAAEAHDGKGNIIDIAKLPRNEVFLNVYNLGETRIMGKVNAASNALGGGVYHAGLEAYGIEWSFGGCEERRTGITKCNPRRMPGHNYRETVCMGKTSLSEYAVERIAKKMATEWLGDEYHFIRRNCLDFSSAMSNELGLGKIPGWVDRYGRTAESIGKLGNLFGRGRHNEDEEEASPKPSCKELPSYLLEPLDLCSPSPSDEDVSDAVATEHLSGDRLLMALRKVDRCSSEEFRPARKLPSAPLPRKFDKSNSPKQPEVKEGKRAPKSPQKGKQADMLRAVTFRPGKLGLIAMEGSGIVSRIIENSQAQRAGIKVGMQVRKIDGRDYTSQLLDERITGDTDYTVLFFYHRPPLADKPAAEKVADDKQLPLRASPQKKGGRSSSTPAVVGAPQKKGEAKEANAAAKPKAVAKTSVEAKPSLATRSKSHVFTVAFDSFDHNGDGFLDRSELLHFLKAAGSNPEPKSWPRQFEELCTEAGVDPNVGVDKKQLREMAKDMSKEQLETMCRAEREQQDRVTQAIAEAMMSPPRSSRSSHRASQGKVGASTKSKHSAKKTGAAQPPEGGTPVESEPRPSADLIYSHIGSSNGAEPQNHSSLPREALVDGLFHFFDSDDDGRLNQSELLRLVDQLGFEGGGAEFEELYRSACVDFGADMAVGLEQLQLIRLVADLDTSELAKAHDMVDARKVSAAEYNDARVYSQEEHFAPCAEGGFFEVDLNEDGFEGVVLDPRRTSDYVDVYGRPKLPSTRDEIRPAVADEEDDLRTAFRELCEDTRDVKLVEPNVRTAVRIEPQEQPTYEDRSPPLLNWLFHGAICDGVETVCVGKGNGVETAAQVNLNFHSQSVFDERYAEHVVEPRNCHCAQAVTNCAEAPMPRAGVYSL